jgi:hypothetical protein
MKGYEFTDERKQQYSEMNSGKGNPFFGKKQSIKSKKIMSDNHADFTGDKNPLVKWLSKDPKNRESYKEIFKKSWNDRCLKDKNYKRNFREKVSKAISKVYLEGFNPYTNCRKGWFKSIKFNNKFYYCSSYEKRFLEYCESSENIRALQKLHFVIPYKDGREISRNYFPDFLVNDKIVVEIKPKSMLNHNNNQYKIEAGKKYCQENKYEYKLIMEKELENLDNEFKLVTK